MCENILLFAKLSNTAHTPTKGSKFAAGYDLYAAKDIVIKPQDKAVVPTDIIISVPEGTYGRVAPRSGLASKNFIDVGAGVIDADYRGPIGVVLFNHNKEPFSVKIGDRIAQLICEKIIYPELLEVHSFNTTQRGANGFGSTD